MKVTTPALLRGETRRAAFAVLVCAGITVGLYLSTIHSYLLFHSLAEMFAVVIAGGIFIVAWNSRRLVENHYFLFIGTAYAAVAVLEVLHTLAYRGMGIFPSASTDLATQLWVAARLIESVSFAAAPLFLRRKLSPALLLLIQLAIAAGFVALIFTGNFPRCYIDGVGLTRFKIVSEYIVSLLFGCAGVLLYLNRKSFDRLTVHMLLTSFAIRIASEFAFTEYLHEYSTANFLGHSLMVVAFYLAYKAIIETALRRPYDMLFRELKTHEDQLQVAVTDLEAFSYSVSHDLRGPVQSISGFARILREEEGSAFSDLAKESVMQIETAARRMSELIADLLRLSQVTRQEIAVSEVDLSGVADDVVKTLRKRDPNRNIDVRIDRSLRATGDGALLRVALENLIGNAWKYTGRREQPWIEIGSTPGQEPTFYIRDNGAGFDPAQADRLFAPFQRLHSSAEFDGTGVGLTTVKRIITRHGGRIWAEAEAGKGATFFFTLPSQATKPANA